MATKVCFINFWPGFSPATGIIAHLLREAAGAIEQTADERSADIVVSAVYWQTKPAFPHKTIAVIPENQRPNYTLYRYSLSPDFDDYGGRNARLPVWFYGLAWPGMVPDARQANEANHGYEPPLDIDALLAAREPPRSRSRFCCFVAGNPEPHRLLAATALSRIAPVAVYGNVAGRPLRRSKLDLLREFRFNLCFENSIHPGYYTEKLLHAWAAGCVPLVHVDPWYTRDFNARALVNRLDVPTLDEFVDRVAALEADETARAAIVAQPLLTVRPTLEPVVAFLRGAIEAIATGGSEAAEESMLRGSLAMQPGRPDLLVALGDRLMRQARYGEAAAAARAAVEADGGPAALQLLGQAVAATGRLDEARDIHWRMTEAVGGLFARTMASDRRISDGDRDGAVSAFVAIRSAMEGDERRRARPPLPAGAFAKPLQGVAIDRTNWLARIDADEIAAAIGIPVRLFAFDELQAPIGNDQPLLFLRLVSLGAPEYGAFRHLSALQPRHVVAAWLFDNHTAYLNNALIAHHCDVAFPAHGFAADYLQSADGGAVGPAMPLCVTQWSRAEVDSFWRAAGGQPRDDRLHGRFSYYPLAHARNRLVQALAASGWDADIGLDYRGRPYHAQGPRERFLAWRRFKTSLHLPVANDLSMRVFDALAAGHVPIVPRATLDLDAVIPPADQTALPIIRLEEYSVEAVKAAHGKALAAFERGGEAQAAIRHAYVRDRHLLVHRIAAIVRHVNSRYAGTILP